MNSIRKLGKAFVKCQWGFLFVLPFIAADTGLYSENLINDKSNLRPPHPSLLNSTTFSRNASSSSHQTEPLSSTHFHTLIGPHHFNETWITQLSKTGSANLHKLFQKLKNFKDAKSFIVNLQNISMKQSSTGNKLLGVNKIASSIPKYISNNTRLKRQLEGIFHVRGTSTTRVPILPRQIKINLTTSAPILLPRTTRYYNNRQPQTNGNFFKRLRGGGQPHNKLLDQRSESANNNSDLKNENKYDHRITEDGKIETTANFNSNKSNIAHADDAVPNDFKGKRNFTVEIVEIARKTTIKQDNKQSGNIHYLPTSKPLKIVVRKKEKEIDFAPETKNLNEPQPQPKIKLPFRQVKRPRLKFNGFPKFNNSAVLSDNSQSATQPNKSPVRPSVRYKPNKSLLLTPNTFSKSEPVPSATTALPISEGFQPIIQSTPRKTVEISNVKAVYQEQIPYNDRDVDEADLRDYLEGHSTFGSKGNFKHSISNDTNIFVPTNGLQNLNYKNNHGVKKRNPSTHSTPNLQQQQRPSRSRSANDIAVIEQASVKERQHNNPKTTVYTATGIPVLEAEQPEDKSVYQYTGMGNKDKANQFPKLAKSTLDELYRQGHPAIAKPGSTYKGQSLAEPFGTSATGEDEYNPFRANPLVDEPPLKYDPESDRFYGNPKPDKDKIAQSNRPEPVQIENEVEERMNPSYQESERRIPTESSRPPRQQNNRRNDKNVNNNNNDEFYYKRAYEPPEYNNYDSSGNDRNNNEKEDETDTFIKDFVSLDNNFQTLPRPSDENFRSLIPPEAETDDRPFEPDRKGSKDSRENSGTTNRNSKEDDDFPEYEDSTDDYGASTEEFDQSYVDALKNFDDEIKKIQEDERNGVTHEPPTATGEPLLITSPGPPVSYREDQRNAPRPTPVTQPTYSEPVEQEEEIEEEEEEERPAPDNEEDRERGGDRTRDQSGNEVKEEEPEDEAEEEEESENDKATVSKDEDDDKPKNGDESQHVKINKVVEVKKDGLKEDKSGNLDDDISRIDAEFSRRSK